MEQEDNLPIGTAQEPVEEAYHSSVRTLTIYTYHMITRSLYNSTHGGLCFNFVVVPPKIKITAE